MADRDLSDANLGGVRDADTVWEDERAPAWRRRRLAFRLLGALLLSLTIAAFIILMITNSGWVLLATILLAGSTIMTLMRSGTYTGRLERPKRNAEQRARMAAACARRAAQGEK